MTFVRIGNKAVQKAYALDANSHEMSLTYL